MRILIYGDSNSWGYLDDGSGQRFGGRWPQQMASQLGAEIIEECLPGRVTHGADPAEGPQFDGTAPFLAILMSHQPLDHVIIIRSYKYCNSPNCLSLPPDHLHDGVVHAEGGGERGEWG